MPRVTKTSASKPKKAQPYSISYQRADGTTLRFNDVTKVHPALKSFFCYGMNKVGQRMKMKLEESLSPLKVSAIHIGAMWVVESSQNISQNRLADEMGLDKATMVKIVDHLESMKLVERDRSTKDRRINYIKLTEAGRKWLLQARKISEKAENEFLKKISAAEKKFLKAILIRMLD